MHNRDNKSDVAIKRDTATNNRYETVFWTRIKNNRSFQYCNNQFSKKMVQVQKVCTPKLKASESY